MRIALLGKGKTGGKVAELHSGECTVFDTSNPPTVEKLQGHDVIVSFLPGEPFSELIPMLIESKLPVITGSTGFDWPEDISDQLIKSDVAWVKAHNFSLGMNLMKQMIMNLSKAAELFKDFKFHIHEVHHTKKLDAPSGTAISWANWLGLPNEITSERTGDVVGDHMMTLETATEKITIRHEALDRKIFAEGALWASAKVLEGYFPKGLNDFQTYIQDKIFSN
jgi:4-hydroxy-tetrahydrodipicolinate reductase